MDEMYPNRMICPELNLLPPNSDETLYQTTLDYFHSIPWTSKLLSTPATGEEDVGGSSSGSSSGSIPGRKPIVFTPTCKNPLSPDHDQLYSQTLNVPGGLEHVLSFFHPKPGDADDPSVAVERVHTLFSIGPGLSGLPSIIHGGMTMTLCDEALAAVTFLNFALGKDGESFRTPSVTAGLDIRFLRPIKVGQVVMATAWMETRERRKTRLQCVVTDEEGRECARCFSTWIAPKASL